MTYTNFAQEGIDFIIEHVVKSFRKYLDYRPKKSNERDAS